MLIAERGGFEPPKRFRRLHAFQACLFSHSSISPCVTLHGFPYAFAKPTAKIIFLTLLSAKKAILFTFYPQFKTQIGRQASSNCVLVPGRQLYAPLKALRLRRSRTQRQMTAEVRKLAKEPHSTLLLNFLMTVLG